MAFTRRPSPLELGSSSTPASSSSSSTPPSSPGFKFWKKQKAAVPAPPKSPTFALSNSPLHPNAQQQQQQRAAAGERASSSSAAGPQSILIRHDAPRPAPLASHPLPAPFKSALPPSPPPTPAAASSSSSSSSSSSASDPTPPPPTPRRKSSSSESLSNRRSGAVFPADLLASATFRSLVSDLPPSPRRPTFPLGPTSTAPSTPTASEFGEQVRRASDGSAVVSTRRTGGGGTGGGARSGSPKSTLPAWARVEPPSLPVASGSVPAASGRRFGHGRKRSNSMSNIPLMTSSPLAGPSATPYPTTARDDASFEYLPSAVRPATTLFGGSAGSRGSFGSPISSSPPQLATRAQLPPMRSSRPAAPAVRTSSRAGSVRSTPPVASSSPPISNSPRPQQPQPQHESLMSGFPSFVQPQLASFRTLERLHDGSDKHGRSSSPLPPMPTWPSPAALAAAAHPADSLPEVWVIPATPDLAGSSSSSDTDDTVDEQDPDLHSLEDDVLELSLEDSFPTTGLADDADAHQQAPIALDFGFDFGASLRFGSDDSLSAILSSSAAATRALQPEQAIEAASDEDEQVTPKLAVVALIDSPEPIAAPVLLDEDNRRDSAGSDFSARAVGDGSELDSELARMIASLSVDSLSSASVLVESAEVSLVAPATQPNSSLRSPAVSAGSATPSPGLGAASLEQFPAPPVAAASATPGPSSSANHGHSHSVPVLSGLGLGLTLDPASSILLRRRQAAAEHESQHGRSASVASASASTTAPLVRDHRRPFYLASASTPALSFTPRASPASSGPTVAPLTPPLTAGALAAVQESSSQGSPSDCYLPRGETTDDLADLLANSRPASPSDDEDDDESHGLAYRLAGPSGSFSAATSRSSTISSLSSVRSNLVSRAASGKRSIASTTTTSSSSACASDFGDDDDEGEVEFACVTETALPVRWAFASSTSGDLLAKTPPMPPPTPTRPLPIPEIEADDDDDDAYAGMAL